MYTPKDFEIDETGKLHAFMRCYSFATLVTTNDSGLLASHLPLIVDEACEPYGRILGHMARENSQWEHFEKGNEALAVFQGPHAYVSPAWYSKVQAVPTWNYVVVHAYGPPSVLSRERLVMLINDTVTVYEGQVGSPWDGDLHEDFKNRLMDRIVGFEIPITRIEGKFKLGQNRSLADQHGAYRALLESPDPQARALAAFMDTESEG